MQLGYKEEFASFLTSLAASSAVLPSQRGRNAVPGAEVLISGDVVGSLTLFQ